MFYLTAQLNIEFLQLYEKNFNFIHKNQKNYFLFTFFEKMDYFSPNLINFKTESKHDCKSIEIFGSLILIQRKCET